MKHIKFPSIEQFRHVVNNITRQFEFVGKDENDNPIFNSSLEKPKIKFKGTVKLHGTNAGVAFNDKDGMWVQSKENIITPQNDNAGFAQFVLKNQTSFHKIFEAIKNKFRIDTDKNTIVVFGEWAGKSIQKGVAISNIDKSFFIFAIKVAPIIQEDASYFIDSRGFTDTENNIFNINDFKTFGVEIDFNKPEAVQELLTELTLKVEEECPVASKFGFNGVGEGIVWEGWLGDNRYLFKVKGEKHSTKSKEKIKRETNTKEDSEKLKVAEEVTPSWRLEQGITEVFNTLNGGQIDRKLLGSYLKWVLEDVVKEDMDIILKSGFELKEVSKYISEIARNYFFNLEKL